MISRRGFLRGSFARHAAPRLDPDDPARDPDAGPGTAFLDVHACLAHQGTFCSVCHERCPVPGAITVTRGKPRIEPGACDGCGVCRDVCPAPHNAVILLPASLRGRIASGGG